MLFTPNKVRVNLILNYLKTMTVLHFQKQTRWKEVEFSIYFDGYLTTIFIEQLFLRLNNYLPMQMLVILFFWSNIAIKWSLFCSCKIHIGLIFWNFDYFFLVVLTYSVLVY